MTHGDKDCKKTEWLMNDRFGLFVHFGLYAIPSRGEWVKTTEEMSNEDYQKYFDEFNPIEFDAVQWAKTAKNAGMKYAVLTAKHHEGFCLFDSQFTDYKCTNTKYKKDIVKEFLEAFRNEGLKVGLYYSLLDWHHEDYPHYQDRFHPMRNNEKLKDKLHNFENYVDYLHKQVEELCKNYGTLDIMWFDFSYDDYSGEKWHADQLVKMIKSYQPEIIINNRLEADAVSTFKDENPCEYAGDFTTPEQLIPPKGFVNKIGNLLPWEACLCLNDNWGYSSLDNNYKPSKVIIRKMVECCAKGGNVILNAGPDAKGRFSQESLEIMKHIGEWMKDNAQSIYGCSLAGIDKPEWGWYTKKGNKIYAHIFEQPMGYLVLDLPYEIKKIRLLSDGSEIIPITKSFNLGEWKGYAFISFCEKPKPSHFYSALPNEIDTVLEIEI